MTEHYDGFWHLPPESDISNLATATIEIIIALCLGALAIGIAYLFYKKEKTENRIVKDSVTLQTTYRKNRLAIHVPSIIEEIERVEQSLQDVERLLQHPDMDKMIPIISRYIDSYDNEHEVGTAQFDLKPFDFCMLIVTKNIRTRLQKLIHPVEFELDPKFIARTISYGISVYDLVQFIRKNYQIPETITTLLCTDIFSIHKNSSQDLLQYYDSTLPKNK